jgi:hypothetical protein
VEPAGTISGVSRNLNEIQVAGLRPPNSAREGAMSHAQERSTGPPGKALGGPQYGQSFSSPPVPHSSILMREVDRLGREAKWSNKELAAKLGVDPTMLMHLRAGRNLFSASLLGRIAQVFPLPLIDDLIVHHLRVERAAHDANKLVLPSDLLAPLLAPTARKALRQFVLHFARTSVETGRGLYVMGKDASLLTTSAQFVAHTLREQGISVERITGNTVVTMSGGRGAVAAALVIVERVEFASDSVMEVLRRRSDVVKPVVVTSTQPPEAFRDTHLARTFASMLHRVNIEVVPSPSRPSHVG